MKNNKRKTTFLLVVPYFEDIYHSFYAGEIIKGVTLAASRHELDILVHITDRFDRQGWLNTSLLNHDVIDGVIFADINDDLSLVKKTISRGLPYIVLNNSFDQPINSIAIDNRHATVEIVRHLVKLGHSRIATIAGDQATQAGQARLEAFKDAMDKNGLEIPRNFVAVGNFLRTPARVAATKLLNLKARPTAIFAASDVMAMEVMDVARALKIKVPEELSIVGFDDNPLNISSRVRLTTVFQPLVEMGRMGAEHLKQISQGKAKLPVKAVLAAKFVARESTGEAPADAALTLA